MQNLIRILPLTALALAIELAAAEPGYPDKDLRAGTVKT
jgi:hypothetical protein